jgi:hypothetical protein
MITNIPTEADYENTALPLLNLAWENTIKFAVSLDEAKQFASESIPENDYWIACQSQLSTAVSLVQQATEFLLKARIASVSPYLLITGTPREWPKGCNSSDTPFADFYAIDAQDLIRAHDTVAATRLPDGMKILFEEMRKLRNSIMHTVDNRLKLEVKQVVAAILEISNWSVGSCKWIEIRREHIEHSPNSIAYEASSDQATYLLAREMMKAVDILDPTEAKRFFGFDKKQRRYICPACASDCEDLEFQPNLAFLLPNEPSSTNLHCFLCGNDFAVIRKNCPEDDCKGNVLSGDDECCLTCFTTPQ